MDFEYRGVKASIPQDMLDDARDHMGFDIPGLLKTAINRMLRVGEREAGNFRVAVQIMNPSCERDSCDFQIKIIRV